MQAKLSRHDSTSHCLELFIFSFFLVCFGRSTRRKWSVCFCFFLGTTARHWCCCCTHCKSPPLWLFSVSSQRHFCFLHASRCFLLLIRWFVLLIPSHFVFHHRPLHHLCRPVRIEIDAKCAFSEYCTRFRLSHSIDAGRRRYTERTCCSTDRDASSLDPQSFLFPLSGPLFVIAFLSFFFLPLLHPFSSFATLQLHRLLASHASPLRGEAFRQRHLLSKTTSPLRILASLQFLALPCFQTLPVSWIRIKIAMALIVNTC